MKKVAFYTLGCKLNFSETSTIGRQFEDHGFSKVAFHEAPDVFIINTCSVTENADKKCRKIVREAQKINPAGFVAIVGCYAQLKPTEIAQIPGVDAVLGAAEKFRLLELLPTFTKAAASSPIENKIFHREIIENLDYHASYSINDRTRTFLKVQDGCDFPCSYCTIPLARGKSRSDSLENVLTLAKEIGESGVKEIVLTGVNVGDFGIQNGIKIENFIDLAKALDQAENVARFRISSIEPQFVSEELIDLVADSHKFAPHFHIPLQSGSNKVLALMKRRYKRELYAEKVNLIKTKMPHACIGVDVIVGHPGETEEAFNETLDFIKSLPVSYLHVFSYSERAHTDAVAIEPKVPQKTIEHRSKVLHMLSDKLKRAFYEEQAGSLQEVIFEADIKGNLMEGFTGNYLKVQAQYDPLKIGEMVKVKLEDLLPTTEYTVSEVDLFETHH